MHQTLFKPQVDIDFTVVPQNRAGHVAEPRAGPGGVVRATGNGVGRGAQDWGPECSQSLIFGDAICTGLGKMRLPGWCSAMELSVMMEMIYFFVVQCNNLVWL